MTDAHNKNTQTKPDKLWVRQTDLWETIKRKRELNPVLLQNHLQDIPNEISDFIHDFTDFQRIFQSSTNIEMWNDYVSEMNERELLTTVFTIIAAVNDGLTKPPRNPHARSDFKDHAPYSVIIGNMQTETVWKLKEWIESLSVSNKAVRDITHAIARHADYDIRFESIEPARSRPIAMENNDYMDTVDWYDPDEDWLTENASIDTFTHHLINHWTDSPSSQGGVIAREAAYNLSINPIWNTITDPYKGYYGFNVPFHRPPNHITTRFDSLRRNSMQYYNDKGIDSITLYRGMSSEPTTASPLESWTDERREAEKYAGDDGIVIMKDIPTEYIVFSHEVIPDEKWNSLVGYKGGVGDDLLSEFAVLGGTDIERV